MNDERLIASNLCAAIDTLGVRDGGGKATLYVHQWLTLQAFICRDECDAIDIIDIVGCNNDEMPLGYEPVIRSLVYFPWALEYNGRRLDFTGGYDAVKQWRAGWWKVHGLYSKLRECKRWAKSTPCLSS